jgi:hypothetical protein
MFLGERDGQILSVMLSLHLSPNNLKDTLGTTQPAGSKLFV